MEIILKDQVKISGFKDSYQFFMMAKARKSAFYISFGDAADQTLADYRLQEVIFKPSKMDTTGFSDVTLVLEPLSPPDFLALIEVEDNLRVEFFYEGWVHYFDVEVSSVKSYDYGLGFSATLPLSVSVKQRREMLLLPAANDADIKMSINGQSIDIVDISGGGASVLLPHANLYDVEVGKAIKQVAVELGRFQIKVSAEVRNMRPHADSLKLVVGLRFIFFGKYDEDQLLHLVKQKLASLLSRQ